MKYAEMCSFLYIKSFISSNLLQESSVTTAKEATAPGSTKPAATPGQDNSDEAHQSEPVSSSRTERWVTSTGQLLRRER